MNKNVYLGLVLLIVFCIGLSSCHINNTNKVAETSTVPILFTQWESQILASDMAFQGDVAGSISGKNYLFCSANSGASTQQQNTYVTIVILDITNPEHPNEISSLQTGQDEDPYAYILKLKGTTLYALTADNLWIIDVSDPKQPKEMGQMQLTDASNIEVSGKYAYITSNNETNGQIINTIDITDSVHPVNVGQITIRNSILGAGSNSCD
jgi:hypothetical protein